MRLKPDIRSGRTIDAKDCVTTMVALADNRPLTLFYPVLVVDGIDIRRTRSQKIASVY